MPHHHQNRSGITLLFVVSMLVLFLLMGTAFVVVSNDFLRSSQQRIRKDIHVRDGSALVEKAFYDLVRGPSLADSTSPLRGHSLLADMYGYGFSANVRSATPNGSEQFITMRLDFAGSGRRILDGSAYEPDPVPALAGLVMTVVTGPAQGLTSRIVDHQVSGDASSGYTHTLIVLPQWIDNAFNISNAAALVGERVIVNGRPFAGSGAGNYNPYVSQGQPALGGTALQPNQRYRSLDAMIGRSGSGGYLSMGNVSTGYFPNSAGPNESYDAFDLQNMFLAGINPDGSVLQPSFHRQSLFDHAPNPARANFRAFPDSANGGITVDNDNNGQPDGVWIDIGLPRQTSADGIHYKPLVSYTVVDLDGRINVNAHGNLRQSDSQMSELEFLDDPISQSLHRGQGYGPPEINMVPLLLADAGKMMYGDGASYPGRYGVDGKPGEPDVRDGWSSYKLFGYPDENASASIPGTVDQHFGTTMDLHGRFAIGYPKDIRDLSDPDFPIGLPVSNMSSSWLPTEAVDSAYEMSFATGTIAGPDNRGFDTPFTPRELEGALRRNDPDSNMLADRLWQLGFTSFTTGGAINSITTDSFEVPTTVENLPYKLYSILNMTGDPDFGLPSSTKNREQTIRDMVIWMLPPEVMRGLPMNVNRAFGDGIDNNGNGVIDEMGEVGMLRHPSGKIVEFDEDNDATGSGDTDAYLARVHFARHLFMVTLLSTERVDRNGDGRITLNGDWYDFNDDGTIDNQDWLDYRRLVGQWAINSVDFRDPDSIMTPFELDLNPWNGWDVDGDVSTEETELADERIVLWGSERPELLISETFASHDRRTQDLDYDPTGNKLADGDDDLDSNLVPNVSAFFELYNPWVMNDANQVRPAEFYDSSKTGIDLQKTSLDGSSPVWRLVVTGTDEADLDPDDPINNETTAGGGSKAASSVRRIYFTEPSFTIDTGPEVYYPDDDIDVGVVPPGVYAVVGSAGVKDNDDYVTHFGRRFTPDPLSELDDTRRIALNPRDGQIKIAYWDKDNSEMAVETRSVVNIPIGYHNGNWKRNLGISDPLNGYADQQDGGIPIEIADIEDGQKYVIDPADPTTEYAFDEPIDKKISPQHYDDYLANDGVRGGYRTVHLQRLANPLLAYNSQTNPYRTIDSSSVDLVVFNGVEIAATDPLNAPEPIRFGSFERRSATDDDGGPAENGQNVADGQFRLLFKNDRLGHLQFEDDPGANINGVDLHVFSRNLIETFGGLNQAYRDASPADQQPFAALTWNNRPFASQLEMVNVPFTSSYWMTRLFNAATDGGRDVYAPPKEEQDETEARHYTAHFPHLLNFYADEVVGTSGSRENTAGLHRVFDYLEVPSRFIGTDVYVNPNSFEGTAHGLSYGLTAPFDTVSNYRYPGKLNINTVLDERVWNGLMMLYALDPYDATTYADWNNSRNGSGVFDFANPYRSPIASNLVPQPAMVVDSVECGLFRPDAGGEPLFDYAPATKQKYNNDDRAAYFKYDQRQRLGNLVTSRSSVFAVWITVGYFELDSGGGLREEMGTNNGCELGAETGEVVRNRGFFIFDRSIPVAFEPGQNHNVDRAVLVRSIIE